MSLYDKLVTMGRVLSAGSREERVELGAVMLILSVAGEDAKTLERERDDAIAALAQIREARRDTSPAALAWERELETLHMVVRSAAGPEESQRDVEQCALGVLLLCVLSDPLLILAVTHIRMELERRGYELAAPERRRGASTTLAPEGPSEGK